MNKTLKYIYYILGVVVFLPLLILFLLYSSPIQRFATKQVSKYLLENMGIVARMKSFQLDFPLDITLQDVYVGKNESDTIGAIDFLHVKVNFKKIFKHQLLLEECLIKGAKFNISDDVSEMSLGVVLDKFRLTSDLIDLKQRYVSIPAIDLSSAYIKLNPGKDVEVQDTTVSQPIDWTINAHQINLDQIVYEMFADGLPYLTTGITAASMTDGLISLNKQTVDVDSVQIKQPWCQMVSVVGDTLKKQTHLESIDTSYTAPWIVKVNAFAMDDGYFMMRNEDESTPTFSLLGIGMRVDSLCNKKSWVNTRLRDLWMEHQSGATLSSMSAYVGLDSCKTYVQGGCIKTSNSMLNLEVSAETGYENLPGRKPLALTLFGNLGLADIVPYFPELPTVLRDKKVNINTSISLTSKRVHIGHLILDLPSFCKLTGSGTIEDYNQVNEMEGSFILRGELPNVQFVQEFIGNTGLAIPLNMNLLLKLKADKGKIQSDMMLCCDEGCFSIDGTYGLDDESYDGEVVLNRFPLYHYLPDKLLGRVTARIRLSGQSFDFNSAVAEMNAYINHFDYNQHDYNHIALNLNVDKSSLRGSVISQDKVVPLGLIFKGDSLNNNYSVLLRGKLGKVDIHALNFISEPLAIGTSFDVEGTISENEKYTLKLQMDSVKVTDAAKSHNLGCLDLHMSSDLNQTSLKMRSGDLSINFHSDTSLMGYIENIGKSVNVIQQQLNNKNINMEEVEGNIPPFELEINGANNNVLTRFFKTQGFDLKNMVMGVSMRKRGGLRLGALFKEPKIGMLSLDSLHFGAWQTGKSLIYTATTTSSSKELKGLFNVGITGGVYGNRIRVEMKQKDEDGNVGFDFGVNAQLRDSAFTLGFFPTDPILAFSKWKINDDNHIDIFDKGKIRANFEMSYKNKFFKILSLSDEGINTERILAQINGIDLKEISGMLPFMPDLSGVFNAKLLMYTQNENVVLNGDVGVNNFGYARKPVGTFDLNMDYLTNAKFEDHNIKLCLTIDELYKSYIQGKFSTSESNHDITLDVDLPKLPLTIINPFMPEGLMTLNGFLGTDIKLRGTMESPQLNGALSFHDATADVVMLGTKFYLDSLPLKIVDGKLNFNKYRFIAPNNSDLVLNGNVILTPFDKMKMDLKMEADNFEVVNVKKNKSSMIYGKAYADIFSTVIGPMDNLDMSGRLKLLNTTDVVYTLRSSDPALEDKSVDLVRFIQFAQDTVHKSNDDELRDKLNSSGFAMKMQIEIGNQVRAGVDLSEDGTNHVDIQGGGNLQLETTPENGMKLSGKYILKSGVVEYNVPIVGKKEFGIRSGSFVEWTGDVMNPLLNISAGELVKADVEDGDQSRQVIFESIIRIKNNLSKPDIIFDLSAPNDMVIQNQLATFSPEERTRQALNLLIYNSYTAPGTTAANADNSNMANNALYNFVENELNKYTRKAGLTVGFDSRNTEDNVKHTDVTYQFSKQLFNDRIRVKIGGRISADGSEGDGGSLEDNLVDDISIEYVLTKRQNLYAKVFRHSNYESVLDGEVIQTGGGIVWRKNFRKFKELFKNKNRQERRAAKEQAQAKEK